MNQAGRLPGFAMLHVGMDVRLTTSVEPPDGVVDATGTIVGIDLHTQEPLSHRRFSCPGGSDSGTGEPAMTSFVVLRHQPRAVYVKLSDCDIEFLLPRPCRLHNQTVADKACPACNFLPGVLAVKPCTNQQAWSVHITCITDGNDRDVRVYGTQLPLVCLNASTLHVIQGTPTDPGLIFHWAFPRKLRRDIR